MVVHNLAEYVAYHQQKLREQSAGNSNSGSTASPSTSTSTPQPNPKSTLKSGTVTHIHSMSAFKSSIETDEVVVVDFFATWCGPCKVIAPTIAKWSEGEYGEKGVKFVKIDVDEAPEVAQEYGVRAMPTFKIFKGGKEIDEVVGANAPSLKSKLDALLKALKEGVVYEKPPASFNIMQYLPMLVLAVLVYRWYMGI